MGSCTSVRSHRGSLAKTIMDKEALAKAAGAALASGALGDKGKTAAAALGMSGGSGGGDQGAVAGEEEEGQEEVRVQREEEEKGEEEEGNRIFRELFFLKQLWLRLGLSSSGDFHQKWMLISYEVCTKKVPNRKKNEGLKKKKKKKKKS